MPLFINRDQMFAHQVHLLEHKLRSKEERILDLETEKAILHLRLAEKVLQLQRNTQSVTRLALGKILADVQNLKQDLSEIFAVYANGVSELEGQSKRILEQLDEAGSALNGCHGDDLQSLRSHIHNTLVELRGNIRVHCRVRPVLPLDQVQPSSSTLGSTVSEEVISAVGNDTVLVNCLKNGNPILNKVFEFERVHGPEDSQNAVFEEVKSLLTSLLDGYNVCIMAYGQTGSGKTHTMMGSQGPSGAPQPEEQQGIIPKAAVELFSGAPGQHRDVITTASGTSEVPSLRYERVRSAPEVMQLIRAVVRLRARCPTLVHAHSSRSHLVVTVTVSSESTPALALARRLQSAKREPQHCPRRETKLQLVDLAGSECVGMSGVTGSALWETSCINRSLSALSDVLGALAAEQRPHVPYRNSKLTHLLQDAIGGDAKLLVMLCVSPAQQFITESLQSLSFGSRARQVQRQAPHRKNNNLKTK
ncbi:hypothetical protein NHX12_026087 [Muraenolepis orangiensis]|uniref:Kinesin motor domain-containing protein n=1 Tax=Muraenolepis orangiensis TaxID=630683 RepID=A0A9Q0IRK4_9TELE|nr:hypothetical protein NHX12_026087 [Muraenolepis orangiensis]